MRTKLLFTALVLFGFNSIQAQVGTIKNETKKKTEERKSTSSKSSSSSSSGGGGDNPLADFLFDKLVKGSVTGLIFGQIGSLKQIESHPQVLSIEVRGHYGNHIQLGEFNFGPTVRGNFGIFATEIRMPIMGNPSSTLTTLDWQFLKFNVPIKAFRFSTGIGFSRVMEINEYYPEYTMDLEINLWKNKLVFYSGLRTSNIDSYTHFRREFNSRVEVNAIKWGKVYFNPYAGFKAHNYLDKYDQTYVIGGINFRYNILEK